MKTVLVFAPPANPTYTPLGIATLAEYIRHTESAANIEMVDLNLTTWRLLADSDQRGRACRDFMQGRAGDFYDRPQYQLHQEVMADISDRLTGRLDACRQYLEKEVLAPDLRDLMQHWAGLILRNDPDLIGFSIMYPRQVVVSLAVARYIRHLWNRSKGPERRIVIGGATASILNPAEILHACPFVDAVVAGEGEIALRMLCRDEPFERIPGLSYRGTGRILTNRKPDTLSLTEIPIPSFEDVDLPAYFNPTPVLSVIFSRGCMWRKCRFCAHNFSYSGYRKRQVAPFVDHLERLNVSKGVRHFYFADQYVDADDMNLLADEIVARRLDIAYHIMGRPTESYTPEVCRRLYEAGCRWISWGVESGSQRLLDLCAKGTNVETIHRVIRSAAQAGISNLLMMIFGLPASREADLDATFDLLDSLADVTDDITASSFQLWQNTAFAANAATFGLQVVGRERLFDSTDGPVHSLRLFHREKAADGALRPPSGPLEIARWQRRRRIMGNAPRLQGLPCEHTLLYTARGASGPQSCTTAAAS